MEKRSNIKLSLKQGLDVARDVQPDLSSATLANILGVKKAYLLRRSVDARKKRDVHFVITAGINDGAGAPHAVIPLEERPLPEKRLESNRPRPVVVGAGPAGLFAALHLAEAGLCPLVIERGAPVDERTADVARFQLTRVLDTQSNVQFGEGGAGTFSDGKLTTGKNSPLIEEVLRTFVAAGAPFEILWQAKPHIGTDVLADVVRNIRKRIIACGGEVYFHSQLTGMRFSSAGELQGIELSPSFQSREANWRLPQKAETSSNEVLPVGSSGFGKNDIELDYIPTLQLVLACGHSARDTFRLLEELDFELEQKPFSIGVRIEHEQAFINKAQYGTAAGNPALGAADYKLACHLDSGRSVYTFCMCPGGEVVAAASEEGSLCVNGMSRQARDGANANSALLCSVVPQDFASSTNPLSGIEFQREWERAAYIAGGNDWRAPAQRVGEFLAGGANTHADSLSKYPAARNFPEPSYPLGVKEAPIGSCLPAFANKALREALPALDKSLHGFADSGALLTGIESRSSSPVRIVRNRETFMATRALGVYPCGEGAGYAGGIMSAAIDGIRVAIAIVDNS